MRKDRNSIALFKKGKGTILVTENSVADLFNHCVVIEVLDYKDILVKKSKNFKMH